MSEYKKAEQLLSSIGVLEEVRENKVLDFIAKELISSQEKDKDTMIYRLAMMIFHSQRSGPPCIEQLGNSMDIYIRLAQNPSSREIFKEFFKKTERKAPLAIELMTKTFVCFVAAAYVYYKATGGE